MDKILVTGGLGYIGSHVVVELLEKGAQVVIIDDLSNSHESVLDGIEKITKKRPTWENVDIKDKVKLNSFFDKHDGFDGVIHFAASKSVNESVNNPMLYYQNNVVGLLNLAEACLKHKVNNFIFSSSCTVYGEPNNLPINESEPLKPATSPYGATKQMGEEILKDIAKAEKLKTISLRYFNPVGAHPSGLIGELPLDTPQNLVPFVTQTAAGVLEKLTVFGDDYDTPDGSCIRDYIHVQDLADAHIVALNYLNTSKELYEVFNIGTGQGSSVLELIHSFKEVTGVEVPYRIGARREGDLPNIYADPEKAIQKMNWKTKLDMKQALADAWRWETNLRK